MKRAHIVVIDDQPAIHDGLRTELASEKIESLEDHRRQADWVSDLSRGTNYKEVAKSKIKQELYRVSNCRYFEEVKKIAKEDPADLFIVDVALVSPTGRILSSEGLRITQWLRANTDASILIYTENAEKIDEITAIDFGADGFLKKIPNNYELLRAKIQVLLLRRAEYLDVSHSNQNTSKWFGNWHFTYGSRELHSSDGEKILLSFTEYNFLLRLLQDAGELIDRKKLTDSVYNDRYEKGDRRLDNLVNRLRKKLKDPTLIQTVHTQTEKQLGGFRLVLSP